MNIVCNLSDGDTVVHVASRLGRLKMLHTLVQHGADLKAVNKCTETCVHIGILFVK